MKINLNRLMIISAAGLGGCVFAFSLFQREVSRTLIRTSTNNEVMEKLRTHKGALHFLGEPIEPIKAKYNNLSIETDGYAEIKLSVTGPKGRGIVFYTLVKDDQKNNKLSLKSIQLQLEKDDTKRLVIFETENSKAVSS